MDRVEHIGVRKLAGFAPVLFGGYPPGGLFMLAVGALRVLASILEDVPVIIGVVGWLR